MGDILNKDSECPDLSKDAPSNCKECIFSAHDIGLGIWCGFYRSYARNWEERYNRCKKPWLEVTWSRFKKVKANDDIQ